ncbi:MAG: hypothetical protein AB1486_27875 [Planctomycetota bacterium]
MKEAAAFKRLQKAALHFFEVKPWRQVDDTYSIGLHDRVSGIEGIAVVLGNAGIKYGLSVQIGLKGYDLLRKMRDSELDHSSMLARSDAVSLCLFSEQAVRKSETNWPIIGLPTIAADRGHAGLPVAFRLSPGRRPQPLDERDALFLARCLEAVSRLVVEDRLREPAADGERVAFYNIHEDEEGALTLRKSWRTITEVSSETPTVHLDEAQKKRLLARPRHRGRYLVTIFVPPASVEGRIVWTTLLVDAESELVLACRAEKTFDDAARVVLRAFEGKERAVTPAPVKLPRELWTDSYPVFEALKDAMADLRVRFLCREEIPELTNVKNSLSEFLTRGSG